MHAVAMATYNCVAIQVEIANCGISLKKQKESKNIYFYAISIVSKPSYSALPLSKDYLYVYVISLMT